MHTRDILLVLECLDWNIVHVTFGVVAKHKFTSLKARLGEISKAFGLEVLVSQKETIPQLFLCHVSCLQWPR